MESNQRESGSGQWVTLSGEHPRVIARKTLAALTTLLTEPSGEAARRPYPSTGDGSLVVKLDEVPELSEVGGVVRVEDESRHPVAIARIGRSSFAAYRPAEAIEGIEEVGVKYEEGDRVLKVKRGSEPRAPGDGAS